MHFETGSHRKNNWLIFFQAFSGTSKYLSFYCWIKVVQIFFESQEMCLDFKEYNLSNGNLQLFFYLRLLAFILKGSFNKIYSIFNALFSYTYFLYTFFIIMLYWAWVYLPSYPFATLPITLWVIPQAISELLHRLTPRLHPGNS